MFARYRLVIIIAAAVIVVGGALIWWLVGGGSGCGSDDAAKEKALALSADMQAAAQQGTLRIEDLAATTRAVNAAADAYTTTHDRHAYCAALDKIRGKLIVTDRGTEITLPGALLFPTGKQTLTPGGQRNIVPLMDFLKTDGRSILVEGYTDSTGSMATNMKLSQERANTVRSELIKDGIPADRITAVGRGPENPIGDNKTKEGRQLNRRVAIILLNPAK